MKFKTIKMEVSAGNDFRVVALKAKGEASLNNALVEFDFNEVICIVSFSTNLDWLFRDYMNSFLMGWKTVGPDCAAVYSEAIQLEMEQKTRLRDERRQKEEDESLVKETKEREQFTKKTEGTTIELANPEIWEKGKANNTDSYGACIYEFAESWAMLMQAEMANGATLQYCAERTSFELGYLGITGFMYGAAVGVLSAYWIHGEELRVWHNKSWGHEGKGVVNPAILTVPANPG